MNSTPCLLLIFPEVRCLELLLGLALQAHIEGHGRFIRRQVAGHLQLPNANLLFPSVVGAQVVAIVVPHRRGGRSSASKLDALLGPLPAVPLRRRTGLLPVLRATQAARRPMGPAVTFRLIVRV